MSLSNEELVELLKKNPISVGCGILSLGLIASAYYRSDLTAEAETELTDKSAEAQKLATNLKNAAQLKEQYDAVVGAQKEIDARLIRTSEKASNSQYFYKLESDTGVKMLVFNQQPAGKKDPKNAYQATPFTVNVQGTFPELLDYMRRLENGAHFCRVLSATCAVSAQDRNAVLTLNLTLELLGLP